MRDLDRKCSYRLGGNRKQQRKKKRKTHRLAILFILLVTIVVEKQRHCGIRVGKKPRTKHTQARGMPDIIVKEN